MTGKAGEETKTEPQKRKGDVIMCRENETVFLDLETTGLDPERDEVLEIAIIGKGEKPLLHSLCKPKQLTEWHKAEKIHCIKPEDVAAAPSFEQLLGAVAEIIQGRNLVIYNAAYDTKFFPPGFFSKAKVKIQCCKLEYAEHGLSPVKQFGKYQWKKLVVATEEIEYKWPCSCGKAHSALADAFATRAVWQWLSEKAYPTAPV